MTAYVNVNGNTVRCRAKDPSHCRFHVSSDGKAITHYKTREEAVRAAEDQFKNESKANKLSKLGEVKSNLSRDEMREMILNRNNGRPQVHGKGNKTGGATMTKTGVYSIKDLSGLKMVDDGIISQDEYDKTLNDYMRTMSDSNEHKALDASINDKRKRLEKMEDGIKRRSVERRNAYRDKMNGKLDEINAHAQNTIDRISFLRKTGGDADIRSLVGETITVSESVGDRGQGYINAINRHSPEHASRLFKPTMLKDVEVKNGRDYLTLVDDHGKEFKQSLPHGMLDSRKINYYKYDLAINAMDYVASAKAYMDEDDFNPVDVSNDYKRLALYSGFNVDSSLINSYTLTDFNTANGMIRPAGDRTDKDYHELKSSLTMNYDRRKQLESVHNKSEERLSQLVGMSNMVKISDGKRAKSLAKSLNLNDSTDVIGVDKANGSYLIRNHQDRYADYSEFSNGIGSASDREEWSIIGRDGSTRSCRLGGKKHVLKWN